MRRLLICAISLCVTHCVHPRLAQSPAAIAERAVIDHVLENMALRHGFMAGFSNGLLNSADDLGDDATSRYHHFPRPSRAILIAAYQRGITIGRKSIHGMYQQAYGTTLDEILGASRLHGFNYGFAQGLLSSEMQLRIDTTTCPPRSILPECKVYFKVPLQMRKQWRSGFNRAVSLGMDHIRRLYASAQKRRHFITGDTRASAFSEAFFTTGLIASSSQIHPSKSYRKGQMAIQALFDQALQTTLAADPYHIIKQPTL